MRVFWILLGCMALISCSTRPVEKNHYYVLEPASVSAPLTYSAQAKKVIGIDVDTTNYLHQRGLAMQLRNHQLYFSAQHLWAEDVSQGIAQVLVNQLNRLQTSVHFVVRSALTNPMLNQTLHVQVEHFVPTQDSQVILQGQYWLSGLTQENAGTIQRFSFDADLQQDGYPHAVSQLRDLLHNLATQLNNDAPWNKLDD